MGGFFVRCFLMGLPLTVFPAVDLLSKRTFSSAWEREFMLVIFVRRGWKVEEAREGKKKTALKRI